MPTTTTTNISDVFLGSEQSKYAGIALFITILIICLAVLFTSSKIPIEQRLVFVIFILIISIPSILMSLFELTCIVTGGNYNTRWWCWLLAWVLSVMIIFYCIMIIISLFISMSTYDLANERIADDSVKNDVDNSNANSYAKDLMNSYEKGEGTVHSKQFEQPPLEKQYQPPIPPQNQPSIPQQSQHMDIHQVQVSPTSLPSTNGSYTGFDPSDNLSPLESAFQTIKAPVKQTANINSTPRVNDMVEPYTTDKMEMFSLF
jgi:hypothetical protein